MEQRRILVLGGTGMLGLPVVRGLLERGHSVRSLSRDPGKARELLGDEVEVVEGSATDRADVQAALEGMNAAHLNLTPETEYQAMQLLVELGREALERISYVSATTLQEEQRWFYRVDIKLKTEELLASSGIPHVVFRPSWVMETLQNFVVGRWALAIVGKKPPALSFFAAKDFGRIVTASFDDERGLGKRLYVYGPEAIRLDDALARFVAICHPKVRVVRLRVWQARLLARVIGNRSLAEVCDLIEFLDTAGQVGDASETNALYGAPSTTLEAWSRLPRDERTGWPH